MFSLNNTRAANRRVRSFRPALDGFDPRNLPSNFSPVGAHVIKAAEVVNWRSTIFQHRDISGRDFTGSDFRSTNFYFCDLDHTKLSTINMTGALFEHSRLHNAVFDNCVMDGVSFKGCSLSGTQFKNLSMSETIGLHEHGNDAKGIILDNCEFTPVEGFKGFVNLRGVVFKNYSKSLYNTKFDFSHAKLENVDFTGCFMYGNIYEYANLEGVIFDSQKGNGSFAHADLKNASFKNATLSARKGADFSNANLAHADFTSTQYGASNLLHANMTGTILKGADLSSVKNLTQAQINHAIGDSTTKLPSGLHAPASWQ